MWNKTEKNKHIGGWTNYRRSLEGWKKKEKVETRKTKEEKVNNQKTHTSKAENTFSKIGIYKGCSILERRNPSIITQGRG